MQTGFALLATTFVVVACSSKSDDDDTKGNGATGGTAPTAGKPGSAGTTSTAGHGGTGGHRRLRAAPAAPAAEPVHSPPAAWAGTAPRAARAWALAALCGPFACTMPAAATCDSFDNWGTSTSAWFGSGTFTGGFSIYGSGLVRDTAVTDKIHITGMVSTYSGFNIWFSSCSTLAAYTGVTFTLTGTSPSTLTPGTMTFNPQTNSDYPYEGMGIDATSKKGTCALHGPHESVRLLLAGEHQRRDRRAGDDHLGPGGSDGDRHAGEVHGSHEPRRDRRPCSGSSPGAARRTWRTRST